MQFNSLEFALFLIIVFTFYWLLRNKTKHQNALLLVSSYYFYGAWDWRFLFLIFISSLVDFIVGKELYKTSKPTRKKLLLLASITVNIGALAFFKYFNFFADSLHHFLTSIGIQSNYTSLKIILPVGISFYTFQTLSYTFDIYKQRITPTKDILAFFTFVSFFPQLVAGPIERASHLLPQFLKKREFDYNRAVGGLKLILWGLFKKVVIADGCAEIANYTFINYSNLEGSILLFGVVCFAFQIYGDFSGYSDIAIGTARLLGFDLMRNFAFPYFSTNIKEFWQRWHISLSTWFRDYVYIPLGGNRVPLLKQIRNIMVTFTLSGLWHGANWTFIIWGAIHGFLYIPEMLFNRFFKLPAINNNTVKKITDFLKGIFLFLIVCIAWVFFRADSIEIAGSYLKNMFSHALFSWHSYDDRILLVLIPFVIIEWMQRKKEIVLDFNTDTKLLRWATYLVVSLFIFHNWGKEIEFIYFQF